MMCRWILVFVLFYSFCCSKSEIYTKNITDFSRCEIHYSRSESSYTKFYQITDSFRSKDLIFDFHFSVLAPSDAHILIAPFTKIGRQDPVYEIVLGAGSNRFSEIRRLQKSAVKHSRSTVKLLSSLDQKSFWLHIRTDGTLEVGVETQQIPFLVWRDTDPLPVQVFSFNTWPGIEAKWFFDCLRVDNTNTSSEIEESESDYMRLKKILLENYDPYTRPINDEDDLTEIIIKFYYEQISLDEVKSKMSIRGTMILLWKDELIAWDSTEYGNITKLQMYHQDIWRPNLLLFNSANGPGADFLRSTIIEINETGRVTWKAYADMEVWCDASGIGSGNWPKDQHTCEVQFGILSQQDKFIIRTELIPKLEESEWEVLGVGSAPIYDTSDTGTSSMMFKLRRYSYGYTAIYYSPLIMIAITMLITFCLDTTTSARIGLICLQLFILCLMMVNLSLHIPTNSSTVPYIIILYSNGVIASIVALVVTVFVINITTPPHNKSLPQFMCKIITSYYIKMFLSFGFMKSSESYDNLIGDSDSCTNINAKDSWTLFGKFIDRIMFYIYFILICVHLFQNY